VKKHELECITITKDYHKINLASGLSDLRFTSNTRIFTIENTGIY